MDIKAYAYGLPRLGEKREYKKLIEGYWKGKIDEKSLREGIESLQRYMIDNYKKYVDMYPVGEITYYDNMLDMAIIVGLYDVQNLQDYYDLCRGKRALKLTKWFDTNYHYLAPDFSGKDVKELELKWNKPSFYKSKFPDGIPYLIGPYTFLKLSRGVDNNFEELLNKIGEIYTKICCNFEIVHIEEPSFVTDIKKCEIKTIEDLYKKIAESGVKINLITYYDSIDFLKDFYDLPVKSFGIDLINGKENLITIEKYGFPDDKILIAGVVNGRNIWRTDLERTLRLIEDISKRVKNIWISNAGPLYHLPITIKNENFPENIKKSLSFANERLEELKVLKLLLSSEKVNEDIIKDYERKNLEYIYFDERSMPKVEKRKHVHLDLPLFPTTTIGSFPQTKEVRVIRNKYKNGLITDMEYNNFIKQKIGEVIELQEKIGLDVLVHGEFERSDMVEYFAEKLDGFLTTKNGWIISYGTRCYKPPINFGNIKRTKPLALNEIVYARTLTEKPVKAILTGPVTMIAWSYVRDDVRIDVIANQIALCIKEEIEDLVKEGVKIIQIDEPAFREKAPLKKRKWRNYFRWAVNAFNIASSIDSDIQIHTHMCYSDFGEIMEYILKMNFDVISVEATRSRGEILDSFEKVNFDREIGLGVWDVHSPRVPEIDEMFRVVDRALKVIPPDKFWINPDCGLKTRGWDEVIASLNNMVKVANILRARFQDSNK